MVMEREDDYIKGVIYPVRWDAFEENGQQRYKPNPWPIACESFDAFGGFLDVKFREYDFFLGRDNARNFLNYFFSLPADGELHPIHKAWTPQMVETFKIVVNGKTFLPIIPDVRRLIDPSYIGAGAQYAYTLPNRPSLRPSDVLKHRGAMERRIEQIIKTAKRSLMSPDDTSETLHPIASKAIKKAYKTPFMKRPMEALKKGIFRGILYLAPGALAKMASKSVMNYILSDLEDKNLLVEE
jgi:hypothetical protein